MKVFSNTLIILLILSYFSIKLQAQDLETNKNPTLSPEKQNPLVIKKFTQKPVIDGRLDEEEWKSAPIAKDFYQVQPGDNLPPSQPTEVKFGYDEKTLYIAFQAFDEPDKIRSSVAKRDEIFNDDYIGIYLDTFNDRRKAYIFFFNPLGIQGDGIFSEGSGEDYTVDVVMESKGTITETGYIVEAAIPFKSLRYQAGKDKLWGLHVFRRIRRGNNELSSWMPLSKEVTGSLNQAGQIMGFDEITQERTIEFIPNLTLFETGRRVPSDSISSSGRFINQPIQKDIGFNVKLTLSSNITLDFAVNPDFAQVEADAPVLTANQRFPIFFEEKRPFFLEGIDIFRTPLRIINTRTIVDPDLAVKLTVKKGKNTFGLFLSSDNAPGNFSLEERNDPDLRPSIEKFLDKNSYVGVLRLKRDIGKDSSLGFIASNYSFIEKHNQVLGFDGRFRLDPKTIFTFQLVGTHSRRSFFDPDIGQSQYRTGNGFGYNWNYDFTGRHFGYFVSGEGRSTNYRADVGFTRRTNIHTNNAFIRLSTEPRPNAKLISIRYINLSSINYNGQGKSQGWNNNSELSFNFAKQTAIVLGFNRSFERIFEEEFGPKRKLGRSGTFFGDSERSANRTGWFIVGESTPTKQYSFRTFISATTNVFDFDFGAGPRFPRVSPQALLNPNAAQDPGVGDILEIGASFELRPIEKIKISFDYNKSKLTRNDTKRVAFDDNIFSLNSTYQFTRSTFLRTRIDYDTLATRAFGQLLVGWTPNPGTSLFVGYNDDLNVRGFSPFTGLAEPGLRRNSRTFFIKMSYLIRKSF
ncbi:MAG: carbohydrate binding family 9 domain-containing protein [Acidobacteria bacterium]|nr:carbohydrate binding family 9 domain-containing protein [Acidobacteriota bacterium]